MISKRIKQIDSSEIRKVFSLAQKIDDPINLSIGFPAATTPEEIKKAGIQAIKEDFTKYTPTDGIPKLKELIFKKLKTKNKLIIEDTKNITITTGVSGGLFLVYLSIFDPGDEIIIFDPYFPIYKEFCKIVGAKPVTISTYPDFQIDLAKVKTKINSKTKAIVINSPNNPSGAVIPEIKLIELAKIAKENNLIIISDEIYEDFIYEGKHFSIGSIYKNTITLNGFSKTFAMTGWRLGYVSGPKEIINAVNELQQLIFVCAPSISQFAALKSPNVDIKEIVQNHKNLHDYAVKNLSKKYEIKGGNGAFYLFLKSPGKNSSDFIEQAIKNKIILFPGKVFSEKNTHFRLSYATSIQKLEEGISNLNELADKY